MLSKRFNYCFSDVISHLSLRRKKWFKVNFKITKKLNDGCDSLCRHTFFKYISADYPMIICANLILSPYSGMP